MQAIRKAGDMLRAALSPRGGAWIGQLLVLVVLFFLIVPAHPWDRSLEPMVWCQIGARTGGLHQGWPWWFADRSPEPGSMRWPTPIQAWQFELNLEEFRGVALWGDLTIAALCVAAAGPLWRASRPLRRALLR